MLPLVEPNRQQRSHCGSTRARIDASRERCPLAGQPGLGCPLGVEGSAGNVTASSFEDCVEPAGWLLPNRHAAARFSHSITSLR
jgi:hypothetical protein